MRELRPSVPCHRVLEWPEFKAFAARLGVPAGLLHQNLVIRFGGLDDFVEIEHSYLGSDARGAT